jgi:2-dehydropantoate 2-reductase
MMPCSIPEASIPHGQGLPSWFRFKRIAIVGAGAVGSFLGGLLQHKLSQYAEATPEHEAHKADAQATLPKLTLVARGPHGHHMATEGLTITGTMQGLPLPLHTKVHVVHTMAELPPQDLIFITVKGYALQQVAEALAPLCHAGTVIVPVMNGLSYWYLHGKSLKTHEGQPLQHVLGVDDTGAIAHQLPPSQTLGAVIHVPAEVTKPGNVHVLNDARLFLGEADVRLGVSLRLQAVADLFEGTGLYVKALNDIRQEVWRKILINLSLAPTSVLTEATYGEMLRVPELAEWLHELGCEAKAIGFAAGEDIHMLDVTEIHARVLETIADHKSSMLQDALQRKPLEVGNIVASVAALGTQLGVPCPTLKRTLAMLSVLMQSRLTRG